ncbi:MAG: 30S ribosomal protein S1 [Clostridia bacterium]|nr:30S ribosomal protein S1 [Clostridia bacterium]
MNDIEKNPVSESTEDFAAMLKEEEKTSKIRPGQIVAGKVEQLESDGVVVSIPGKADGFIRSNDLVSTDCKVGDSIEAEIIKLNDGEGYVQLSERKVAASKSWDRLIAECDAGACVEAVGREAVNGGLIADVQGVRAFIPASHLARRYVDNIGDFVGKTMTVKIIEVDKTKHRIVASRKAYLNEEKKKAWENIEAGQIVNGTVRRLTDFGAFVDIGGVDGLIHVTDLAWHRVKHPSEIVTPGQEIQVKIVNIDKERERIQLSLKELTPEPWEAAEEKYPVGSIVEGKVVRVTAFGAFVELEPGLDGLVHISQCALRRIQKVEDAVQVGQIVRVKVLKVDKENKRISLSIREALTEEVDYNAEVQGLDFDDNMVPAEEAAVEPVEEAENPLTDAE